MLIRFCIYGLLGWSFEVVWTAVSEKISERQRDWRLTGHTYLWMLPIYGLLAPLGEPVHNFLRPHVWVLRGLVYLTGIWAVEFVTGWLLKKLTGKCPWDYSAAKYNYKGLIRWDYAPLWFGFCFVLERLHDLFLRINIL